MTPERWQRVKDLFDGALAVAPGERRAWLEEQCQGDEALLSEVVSLLAADDEAGSVFEVPVTTVLEEILPAAPTAGSRLGPYRVLHEIGRGGMAVVYAAIRDDDQYHQQVAIKLIKRGMDTESIVARFLKERQILANLEHPAIARLLDGGMSQDGLPYLVMEHIEGEPIDSYCDRRGLSLAERLELFRKVCGGVHFAHQNLVVHRDLKPSNILVDAAGEPKLLDFGIAKLLASDAGGPTQVSLVTLEGFRPMTPEYASPEQVRGGSITTASDIYALGVLLYQLLTGRRPLSFENLAPSEVERVVCEQEPRRPSTVVGRRVLAGDLDTIVLKAMHKRPERRYVSAQQLAEDLRRHLLGLPVIARPDTVTYRLAKFVRRNRLGVAATLLVFLALVASVVVTTRQAHLANAERAKAENERAKAEAAAGFMLEVFATNHPDKSLGETITARQLLDQGAERLGHDLAEPGVNALMTDLVGLAYLELGLYDRAALLLEAAYDQRRRLVIGRDDLLLELAQSARHLGELYKIRADYRRSERRYREALEIFRQRLGESHAEVADCLGDLAMPILHQGRLEEAETLLRQALAMRWALEPAGEHDPPEVATLLADLALVLKTGGYLDEAEARLREALAINLRQLGDGHPEVATNLNNLAELLRERGDCEDAIPIYRQILELKAKLYGEHHIDLAVTQNNYAGCLADLGRWDEAETLYRASLDIRRQSLGADHPEVAGSLNNLARVHLARHEPELAEALLREALRLSRQAHGADHADVATHLDNLATAVEKRGDLDAAETLRREALELHRRLWGDDHPTVARVRHNLADLLRRLGRREEAEEEFSAALAVRVALLGEEHPSVAHSLFGLAVTLGTAGDPQRAEPVLRRALGAWARRPEEGKIQLAVLRSLLGGALLSRRELAEAEPLLLASYADLPDDRTRRRLVELYRLSDRPEEMARYAATP